MRFSKIANLGNAPAIHNQNIVVKTCQSPPAAHHQPTEPTQSLCPVRAWVAPIRPQSLHMVFAPPEIVSLPPISPQSTLLFNVIYQNREKKRKSVEFFHLAASRFKKKAVFKNCKFRKRARNRQPIYYCKDIPEPTSRPPASHRAHTEPLPQQPRQGLFPLQQPTEPPHSLCLIRASIFRNSG